MLTSLLRQLRHNQPDCRIELTVKPSRVSLFEGLADEIIGLDDLFSLPLDVNALPWHFCETSYADSPSTNTEACLRDTYGLTPAPEAWGYSVRIDPAKRQAARAYLDSLPRQHPKTCILHYRGNALKDRKDLDDRTAAAIIRSLNARGYDALIWDANDRSPLPEHGIGQRIEETPPLFDSKPGCCGTLAALLAEADLVVGIDSGILHLASAVGTRAIGCWVRHHPLHLFCPDKTTTHLLPKKEWHSSHQWLLHDVNGKWDVPLGFFEAHYDHRTYIDVPGCNDIALTVDEVLEGIEPTSEPVYLAQPEHDLRLRNWLAKMPDWTRQGWDYLPPITVDRAKGFDVLLRHLKGCCNPTVIETGTTRAPNDFAGAGCATSIFGQFIQHHGGELHSVDSSERNVEFGRSWVREHGPRVQVHQADSVQWLQAFSGQADLVYLDSMDLEQPEHAAHCLSEAQAIAARVKPGGLIAFDDTPEVNGQIEGKGKLAVPWLLGQGWQRVHNGYQQAMRKQ
jgi:hypothetical protein